jgi:hypothetical protein
MVCLTVALTLGKQILGDTVPNPKQPSPIPKLHFSAQQHETSQHQFSLLVDAMIRQTLNG